MVGASICDYKEIDTNSSEIKELVSNSIKEYIIKNWDECVFIEKSMSKDTFKAIFYVEL